MNAKAIGTAAGMTLLLFTVGCSRESDEVAQTPPPPPAATTDENMLNAQLWVDDVEIARAEPASGEAGDSTDEGFSPGDPIQITMNVDDAPPDKSITVQWVGPENQPLGYEIKAVPADQQTLTFTQDNTMDWESGQYRAEVWVGDEKVSEQRFEISAGA